LKTIYLVETKVNLWRRKNFNLLLSRFETIRKVN
jgi:hypothetical protein